MKYIYMCVVLCCISFSKLSAQNIESIFANVPRNVLPMLDKTSRLDMIDLYNSHLPAVSENVYGGQSVMEDKTNDYISIKLTDVSKWQMRLLPSVNDTLIMCVHSVSALGTSSVLQMYKSDWSVKKVDFPQVKFEQFFKKKDDVKLSKNQGLVDMLRQVPIMVSVSKDGPMLIYALSIDGLPLETKEIAKQMLCNVCYYWEQEKFVSAESRGENYK